MRSKAAGIMLGAVLLLSGCSSSSSGETMAHGQPLSHWLQEIKTASDTKARKHAARILGNIGPVDAAIVPALAAALQDKAADVRLEAIIALEKIGPAARDALPALEAAKKDPDARVRTLAAEALKRMQ